MWKQSSKKTFETEQAAYDYALNLLTYRDYSAEDMRSRLRKKGIKTEFCNAVIEKLQHYGFIDEKRYALRVYESWKSKRYYGRQHLTAELHKKNVLPEYISYILDLFSPEEEQLHAEAAAELFIKRNAKKLQQGDSNRNYAAAVRFMAARGFSTRYTHIVLDKLHFEDDI